MIRFSPVRLQSAAFNGWNIFKVRGDDYVVTIHCSEWRDMPGKSPREVKQSPLVGPLKVSQLLNFFGSSKQCSPSCHLSVLSWTLESRPRFSFAAPFIPFVSHSTNQYKTPCSNANKRSSQSTYQSTWCYEFCRDPCLSGLLGHTCSNLGV